MSCPIGSLGVPSRCIGSWDRGCWNQRMSSVLPMNCTGTTLISRCSNPYQFNIRVSRLIAGIGEGNQEMPATLGKHVIAAVFLPTLIKYPPAEQFQLSCHATPRNQKERAWNRLLGQPQPRGIVEQRGPRPLRGGPSCFDYSRAFRPQVVVLPEAGLTLACQFWIFTVSLTPFSAGASAPGPSE